MEAIITPRQELSYYDQELWTRDAISIVGSNYLPLPRCEPQDKGMNVLLYRGVYYSSPRGDDAYVRLLRVRGYEWPFVTCCHKLSYEQFRKAFDAGEYKGVDISIHREPNTTLKRQY